MFGPWKQRILKLESQISELQQDIANRQARSSALFRHGKLNSDRVNDYFTPFLLASAEKIAHYLNGFAVPYIRGWNSKTWHDWYPQEVYLSPRLRVGERVEQRFQQVFELSIPEFVPLIGADKAIIITSSSHDAKDANELLQSLLVRSALLFPHQARYTLLDPAGHNAAFPMRRYLPLVRESGDDVRRELDEVIRDIKRVNETYLDAASTSFEQVPEEIRVNERFEFIFAADFPNGYDRRAIEALQSIGKTGPRAGRYLFLHYNTSHELPRDMDIKGFINAIYVSLKQGNQQFNKTSCDLQFVPDRAPHAELQNQLFDKLAQAKPSERKLNWLDIFQIEEQQWWRETTETLIKTPIGRSGAKNFLDVWFGVNNEGRSCAHGMLGAMTGAGKSNLYHVFIMGLAIRYSPAELRMYLIDGKDGVEFKPYRHLPHAEVVSLHSSADLSRSVLQELVEEKERRNAIFSEADVADLTAYRQKGQPLGILPRILLLVDEYQELFEGDRDGVASERLLQLAAQGRSAGIHMLLASQRFGAAGMMNQTAIFGNVHLRMAMQMTDSDRQSLTEFGRRGKQLITTCDLPGKIVVNDRSGDDGEGANQLGKVAYLETHDRDTVLSKLTGLAHERLSPDRLPLTVIFDGTTQPNLTENPQLERLLESEKWLEPKEWQEFARRPIYQGGLNITDWFSAERPHVLWLGQEFSVRGQAKIVTRRRPGENVLIVGGDNAVRYGMLASVLTSLAVSASPDRLKFWICDRSMAETQWCETLQAVRALLLAPVGYETTLTRSSQEIPAILSELQAEVERRKAMEDDERLQQPSLFVVMTELERVDELRRQDDGYGLTDSPAGQKLQQLCAEGSRVGVHLILSLSGVRPLTNILDERRGLVHFRHRVALQMSENDSFTLVEVREASRLQIGGAIPICALYADLERDMTVRFKPYSIESDIPWDKQLTEISDRLKQWSS